jgi:hypothetical protein
VNLNRPLHLVGYGYYHVENGINHPPTTSMPAAVVAMNITAAAGARPDGGSITGLTVTSNIELNDVEGFTVRRCRAQWLTILGPARRLSILQNYLYGYNHWAQGRATINSPADDNGDILIAGNIVTNSYHGCVDISGGDSAVIMNNVMIGVPGSCQGACQITNNIFYAALPAPYSSFANNLAMGSFLPAGNGNLNNQVAADVFVLAGSPDGQYQLKQGSPAIGAGLNGTDIGAYGGDFPYVLSGLPPLPVVTDITAPLSVNDGETLSVEVKVEVHP